MNKALPKEVMAITQLWNKFLKDGSEENKKEALKTTQLLCVASKKI